VEDGKLTVGADVKLALGVGITLQPSITVDTRPVANAAKAVAKPVAAAVTHTATAVNNTAKKAGSAVKNVAKKAKFW
jgi:uncharacterized Zn-binding protein involved in type VI secretion